jgi:hypothetical protein
MITKQEKEMKMNIYYSICISVVCINNTGGFATVRNF